MYDPLDLDLCVAVSDEATLESCLGRSPDVVRGVLRLRRFQGYRSAANALNAALDSSDAAIVIFPHQDVYLPDGFAENLIRQLTLLEQEDPAWAVVACIGIDAGGTVQGETWSSGIGARIGTPTTGPVEVETVDELLLVIRRESAVRFDDHLPGFHLYGTEIVTSARSNGLSSYVLPLPVVHHSRALVRLGCDYWRAYLHLRRRWAHRLPLPTMFGGIRHSLVPLARVDLGYRIRNRGRSARPMPTGDPASIARELGYEK